MKDFTVKKLIVYILGMFVMSMGISLAINSGLGITPMSSVPYALVLITGLPMRVCMTLVFGAYVLVQFIILGKDSSPALLIQVLISFMLGYFVDFSGSLVESLVFDGLIANIILDLSGIALLSLGLTMYVPMNLPVLPPEGLSKALVHRFKNLKFHNCKTAVDLLSVVLSVVLSLLFLGEISAVGLGTVLAAVLVGQLIPILKNVTAPIVKWGLS